MNLSDEQKKDLKTIIERDAYNIFNDIETAKEELTLIAKSVKETFDIEKKDFNRMLKLYAKSIYDEEKAKNEYFYKLYEEVIG